MKPTIVRKIVSSPEQLTCVRRVDFQQMPTKCPLPDDDNCIRVYGGYMNAVIQIRGESPLTDGGKPRHLIATASGLDKNEVRALIAKLQEIEATLEDPKPQP